MLFGDIETITIPDSTFEENTDGDGQLSYPWVIKFVEIVVAVGFVSDCDVGEQVVVGVVCFLLHMLSISYQTNVYHISTTTPYCKLQPSFV